MSKYSNLYDIDGNIINKAPQHTFTIDEVEQLVDDLTKKVQENPDNNTYKVYLSNAQKWLMGMYNNMDRNELLKRMSFVQDSIKNAKLEAAVAEKSVLDKMRSTMEELKAEYDKENASETDEVLDDAPDQEKPTIMDEYVEPTEEVSDEGNKEDICTLHGGEPETNEK